LSKFIRILYFLLRVFRNYLLCIRTWRAVLCKVEMGGGYICGRRRERGETVISMYCKTEESVFNKKKLKIITIHPSTTWLPLHIFLIWTIGYWTLETHVITSSLPLHHQRWMMYHRYTTFRIQSGVPWTSFNKPYMIFEYDSRPLL